jgi:hypothetical protein
MNDQPAARNPEPESDTGNNNTFMLVVSALVVVLLLIALLGGSWYLLGHPQTAQTLRDVIIIWLALTLLLIGSALVVLIVQVARLIHLLQSEIKPLLEQTNQTVRTVRGTAQFVSQNVSDPVVKLSSTVAGASRFVQLLLGGRKK